MCCASRARPRETRGRPRPASPPEEAEWRAGVSDSPLQPALLKAITLSVTIKTMPRRCGLLARGSQETGARRGARHQTRLSPVQQQSQPADESQCRPPRAEAQQLRPGESPGGGLLSMLSPSPLPLASECSVLMPVGEECHHTCVSGGLPPGGAPGRGPGPPGLLQSRLWQ